jgi:hypothetical protein
VCIFFGLSRMHLLMWKWTSATMAYPSDQGFPILMIKAQRSLPNSVVWNFLLAYFMSNISQITMSLQFHWLIVGLVFSLLPFK